MTASLSHPQPNGGYDANAIVETALRLHDAVGFDSMTAVRLAEAGYDLTGWMALNVVDECAVAS